MVWGIDSLECINGSVYSEVESRVCFSRGEMRCDFRNVDRDKFISSESYVFGNIVL